MLTFVWNLLSFIVALGILVAIHEYGHFWVARRCGVFVERFSIGFGKCLWRKRGQDGTEYVIAAIPLGGYVKMLDERVAEVPADKLDQAFNRKSVWQRIAIVAAGPLANFVFAVFAFWLMYLIGVPSVKPVVGEVAPHSIAAKGGVQSDMQIYAIDGQRTQDWQAVNLAIVGHLGQEAMEVAVIPKGATDPVTKRLDLSQWQFAPESQSSLTSLGLTPYVPNATLELALVGKNSPAAAAGLQPGDRIVGLNGEKIADWTGFVNIVKANGGTSLTLAYQRGGVDFQSQLRPAIKTGDDGAQFGYVGLSPKSEPWPEALLLQLQYGPLDAIGVAMDKTWQLVVLSFKMIGKLFTGDLSVKSLSGPISIAQGAGTSAGHGVVYFLGFLALISVNLGIINLLPLPVLDGGHLVYYFIELLTGRPVPEKIQEVGFRIGAALLFTLMSIAIFNDFTRL